MQRYENYFFLTKKTPQNYIYGAIFFSVGAFRAVVHLGLSDAFVKCFRLVNRQLAQGDPLVGIACSAYHHHAGLVGTKSPLPRHDDGVGAMVLSLLTMQFYIPATI